MRKGWWGRLCPLLAALFLLAGCAARGAPGGAGGSETRAPARAYALLLAGGLGDHSLSDWAWNDGMKKAEADLGVKVRLAELQHDSDKIEPALYELCDDAIYEIIFVGLADNLDQAEAIAASFPEQRFVTYDAAPDFTSGFHNVFGIRFAEGEAAYLAGYCAAGMSQTGVIGVVAPADTEEINRAALAYCEGARVKNPDIRIVLSYNSGSRVEAAGIKALALAQIEQGADVVFHLAGSAGAGVYEAAAESGTWAIGWGGDAYGELKNARPDLAPSILTSAVKRVGVAIHWAIERSEAKQLDYGSAVTLGVREGAVGLAQNDNYQASVPPELRGEIADLEQKIASGEIGVGPAADTPPDTVRASLAELAG